MSDNEVKIDALADDVETIRLAKAEQEKWKAVEDAARGRLEAAMGEAEEGTVAGRVVVKLAHRTRRGLNQAKTKEFLEAAIPDPELRAQFYSTTVYRQLSLVD